MNGQHPLLELPWGLQALCLRTLRGCCCCCCFSHSAYWLPTRKNCFDWLFDWLNYDISWCQKSSPWSQGRKNTIRKERTYDVLYSPYYKEKAEMVQKNTGKKRHLQISKKEKKKKTLRAGQSRSWSAEQGQKKKSGSIPPTHTARSEKK